jgi:hypothetical protein
MVISHALSQMRARREDRDEGGRDGETVGQGVEGKQAGEGGGMGPGGGRGQICSWECTCGPKVGN